MMAYFLSGPWRSKGNGRKFSMAEKKKKIGQVQKRYNPFRKYISVKIYFRDEELIKTIYKEEKLKDLVIRGPFYENGLSIFPEE